MLDQIREGYFSKGDANLFMPLVDELLNHDQYLLLADYPSYIDAQDKVSETWRDQDLWTRMSILNVARMGKFSSDRAIQEYCRDIWEVDPVPVEARP